MNLTGQFILVGSPGYVWLTEWVIILSLSNLHSISYQKSALKISATINCENCMWTNILNDNG